LIAHYTLKELVRRQQESPLDEGHIRLVYQDVDSAWENVRSRMYAP
jgi:hypothetical protein